MGTVVPIRERKMAPALSVSDIWREALQSYEQVTGTRIDQLAKTTSIEQILSEIGTRQTAFKFHRHDGSWIDKFRSLVSESLAPIESVSEIVSQAAQAAFPPAEIIFAAVRHLIQTANAVSADYDKISGFFEELGFYLRQLKVIDMNVTLMPELKVALAGVFESTLVLCGICTKYTKTKRIVKSLRALVSSEDADLNAAYERFRRMVQQAHDIVSHAIYAGVGQLLSHSDHVDESLKTNTALLQQIDNNNQSVINNTTQIQKHLSDIETAEERNKIITWLSSLSFLTKQRETFAKFHKGTGQWLLNSESFQTWFCSNTNSTLSCRGIPGAGKSTLLSAAISYVEEETAGQNVAIVCIFCDYKDPRTKSEIELISSFIRQMAEQCKPLPPVVKTFRDKYLEKRTDPSTEERLSLIKTLSQLFDKTYVFIDALDECPEENRDELLGLLKELEPYMRLFTTSRPNVDISSIFNALSEIRIEAHQSDIQAYLETTIEKNSRLRRLMVRDPRLKDDIIKSLLEKANGMFLLARLQIDYLVRKSQTAMLLRQALDTLSSGLDIFYKDALERVEDQEDWDRDLAKKAIAYIYYAKRPLKTQELLHALSIEPGFTELPEAAIIDSETLLSVSHGLISFDEENNGTAELAHYTLHEHLRDHRDHMIQELEIHLTEACITYLLFDEFENGPCTEPSSVEERLAAYCFLDYASHYWGSHLRQSQSQDSLDLALTLLQDAKKLTATIQILYLSRLLKRNWHDNYPREFTALHVIAYWGLDKMIPLLQDVDVKARDSRGETALHLAAQQGNLEVAQLLLQDGAEIDTVNDRGETALIRAARYGHTALVECLLLSRANALLEDNEKWTAFHWTIMGNLMDTAKLLLSYQSNSDSVQLNRAVALASEAGNETAVQMVLDLGANVNWQDERGNTAISWAIPEGHGNAVRTLLKNGANPNLLDESGNAPLHWAIPYPEITKLLIENGADVNAQNERGRSALHWSALEGMDANIDLLLSYNANVNAKDNYGCTALHAASMRGFDSMARKLIENGADVNEKDGNGWTPLHGAIIRAQSSVIQLLLDKVQNGDSILKQLSAKLSSEKVQAMLGYMAEKKLDGSGVVRGLRSAATDNQAERMLSLLENGADIEELEPMGGFTALIAGIWAENVDCVDILLKNGADANTPSRDGETPLYAAVYAGNDRIVRLLVEYDAEVNSKRHGWTPLLLAARYKYPEIMQFLIENGADVNATDYHDRSALHWAARRDFVDIIELLIAKGAVVDTKDDAEATPLIWAVARGNQDSVAALLRSGADIKSERCLALHAAAFYGHEEMVRQLLEGGANVNARTRDGITAYQIATVTENEEIVELLLKAEADETKAPISIGDVAREGEIQGHESEYYDDIADVTVREALSAEFLQFVTDSEL